MKKIVVLDTNILLDDPQAIFKFGKHEVVIPAIVLEEVDSKKRLQDEIGRNARVLSNLIDKLREEHKGQLNKGVPLENGGTLKIELNHRSFEKLKDIFDEDVKDNRILAVAKNLQEEAIENGEDTEVFIVSNDVLVRVKADVLELEAEKYENDRLIDTYEQVHKGYHEVYLPLELVNKFHKEKQLDFDEIEHYLEKEVFVQDFFLLKDDLTGKGSGVARLIKVQNKKILKGFLSEVEKGAMGIQPRNVQQKMMLELLLDPKIELVCGVGQAGTGKTLIALAAALLQTQDLGIYKKILAMRPVMPTGKDVGFLPGDLDEKLRPWMQPIYDNLDFIYNKDKEKDENIEKIVAGLNIDMQALTYIRGRSIPKQFIILDEAQNTTKSEIKTLVSRVGEGTKIILLGDPEQIDHPYLDSTNNGLTYVIEKMKQEEEVGVIKLEKTERSSLADKAARLL